MNKHRSFFRGMGSLLDGFASLGEGMANIFSPPRPYSTQTSRERLDATMRRRGLPPMASSVEEALRSDYEAVARDFATVSERMHQTPHDSKESSRTV